MLSVKELGNLRLEDSRQFNHEIMILYPFTFQLKCEVQ